MRGMPGRLSLRVSRRGGVVARRVGQGIPVVARRGVQGIPVGVRRVVLRGLRRGRVGRKRHRRADHHGRDHSNRKQSCGCQNHVKLATHNDSLKMP